MYDDVMKAVSRQRDSIKALWSKAYDATAQQQQLAARMRERTDYLHSMKVCLDDFLKNLAGLVRLETQADQVSQARPDQTSDVSDADGPNPLNIIDEEDELS